MRNLELNDNHQVELKSVIEKQIYEVVVLYQRSTHHSNPKDLSIRSVKSNRKTWDDTKGAWMSLWGIALN